MTLKNQMKMTFNSLGENVGIARVTAAAFAAQLAGDAVLRQSNLEDVFVEMTGRRVSV